MALKHTKGCKCKKTGCSKKYCECFQAGIKCSELCQCDGCKNCEEGFKNCDFSDEELHQLHQAKNLIYYHLKQEVNEKNVVKLENNENLFSSFAKNNSNQYNNKIKMSLFNSMNDKMASREENRFSREKLSPYSQIKFEEEAN